MNFLVKWQFTKESPVCFKTQAEIINFSLVPLVEDKSFQDKKLSFYITKQDYTDVRLAVFVSERNWQALKDIGKKSPAQAKAWRDGLEGGKIVA
jgi:hypothetical protein